MAKKDKKLKIDPDIYLSMSEETLHDDLQGLPKDYYFLQQQRNIAHRKMKEKSLDKQKLRAEIFVAEKTSAAYDRAPSDKYVEAVIHDDEDYMGLKAEIIELESNWAKLDSIVKAIEIKAKLVQTLSSNIRYNQ